MRPRWLASLFLLAGLAGCLVPVPAEADAEIPPDDGTLAWLLPSAHELPPSMRVADDATAARFLVGGNPGRPTPLAMRGVDLVADEPGSAQDVAALALQRDDEPAHIVLVVAVRGESAQDVGFWRAYDGHFGMGGSPDDEEDDYSVFYALCGVRAKYGFVRGADAVLVLGNFDVSGDTPAGRGVRGPALELEWTLRQRAGGAAICLQSELYAHARLAFDEGSMSRAAMARLVAAQGLDAPSPPGASSSTASGPGMQPTAQPSDAAPGSTRAAAEPLVATDAGARLERGPLTPGQPQWFALDVADPVCIYLGWRGQLGEFDLQDSTGESVDRGWAADRRDGAYGFHQDWPTAGRFYLATEADTEGTGVQSIWVETTPAPCGPPR